MEAFQDLLYGNVGDFGLGLAHFQQQPPRLDSLAHNAS